MPKKDEPRYVKYTVSSTNQGFHPHPLGFQPRCHQLLERASNNLDPRYRVTVGSLHSQLQQPVEGLVVAHLPSVPADMKVTLPTTTLSPPPPWACVAHFGVPAWNALLLLSPSQSQDSACFPGQGGRSLASTLSRTLWTPQAGSNHACNQMPMLRLYSL